MTRRELFKRLIYTPIVAAIAKPNKGIELFFGHLTYHDIPVVTDLQWNKNRLDYIAQDAFYGVPYHQSNGSTGTWLGFERSTEVQFKSTR